MYSQIRAITHAEEPRAPPCAGVSKEGPRQPGANLQQLLQGDGVLQDELQVGLRAVAGGEAPHRPAVAVHQLAVHGGQRPLDRPALTPAAQTVGEGGGGAGAEPR